MDITYLLFLQEFRNSIHDAWTPFMEWMSLFSITYLLFIPVFIYSCLMAFSRMYVLVHYPTDVLAGVVLGTICGTAAVAVSPYIPFFSF